MTPSPEGSGQGSCPKTIKVAGITYNFKGRVDKLAGLPSCCKQGAGVGGLPAPTVQAQCMGACQEGQAVTEVCTCPCMHQQQPLTTPRSNTWLCSP